jgi:hypothetical protein
MTRITGTLCGDQYTYMILSRSVLFKWERAQTKFIEKVNVHFQIKKLFFRESRRL